MHHVPFTNDDDDDDDDDDAVSHLDDMNSGLALWGVSGRSLRCIVGCRRTR